MEKSYLLNIFGDIRNTKAPLLFNCENFSPITVLDIRFVEKSTVVLVAQLCESGNDTG